MIQRVFFLLVLIALSAAMWFATTQYVHPLLENGFSTIAALTVLYFVFKVVFDKVVADKISDTKLRYSFRKTFSIIYVVVLFVTVITIWIPNPEALLVAYGLITAGIAIALSDLFKNLAGGIIIFFARPYSVGDRIEVNGEFGDVIDIDVMYTTLMEMREWVDGDQATGRLTSVPNQVVLSSVINNYTKDNEFIWDEIKIPVTYGSDWRAASKKMLQIINAETRDIIKRSEKDYSHLRGKYYLTKRATEPGVFMKITDNWIELSVRYVAPARHRRSLHNTLNTKMLAEIEKSKNIKVASQTIDIVGFPKK